MSSGYTDEVADEAHDLIHNAEVEEERMHSKPQSGSQTAQQQQQPGQQEPQSQQKTTTSSDSHGHEGHESKFDKMKEKLHLKK